LYPKNPIAARSTTNKVQDRNAEKEKMMWRIYTQRDSIIGDYDDSSECHGRLPCVKTNIRVVLFKDEECNARDRRKSIRSSRFNVQPPPSTTSTRGHYLNGRLVSY
jgi:hypothetical protein